MKEFQTKSGQVVDYDPDQGKVIVKPPQDGPPLTLDEESAVWKRYETSKNSSRIAQARNAVLFDLDDWYAIAQIGNITGEDIESSTGVSHSLRPSGSKRDAIVIDSDENDTSPSTSSSKRRLTSNEKYKKNMDQSLSSLQQAMSGPVSVKLEPIKPSRPEAGSTRIPEYITPACISRFDHIEDNLKLAKELGKMLMKKEEDYGIFIEVYESGKHDNLGVSDGCRGGRRRQ